ncbi:pentapeptide repeat-containing protein [Marmoricola sp. URHB0036]|uniref:pentapeptide repeat-containing protein n=1 Tax=Marmoricola sp. URHB0036 TaxID=1298863 RepID=UPI0009DBCAAC
MTPQRRCSASNVELDSGRAAADPGSALTRTRSLPSPLWLLLLALLLFIAGGLCATTLGLVSPHRVDQCAIGSERAGTSGPDMHGADLTDARLAGAKLCGADLGGAILRGACLRGAHLDRADLTGAILTGADLTAATTSGTVGLPDEVPNSTSACSSG